MDLFAKLIAFLVGAVLILAFIVGLSFLFAYPTMWLVNALFSSAFLTFVFGATKLTVLQAWMLNLISGVLFKSSSSSSSK